MNEIWGPIFFQGWNSQFQKVKSSILDYIGCNKSSYLSPIFFCFPHMPKSNVLTLTGDNWMIPMNWNPIWITQEVYISRREFNWMITHLSFLFALLLGMSMLNTMVRTKLLCSKITRLGALTPHWLLFWSSTVEIRLTMVLYKIFSIAMFPWENCPIVKTNQAYRLILVLFNVRWLISVHIWFSVRHQIPLLTF